jgi:hypothetical protein
MIHDLIVAGRTAIRRKKIFKVFIDLRRFRVEGFL